MKCCGRAFLLGMAGLPPTYCTCTASNCVVCDVCALGCESSALQHTLKRLCRGDGAPGGSCECTYCHFTCLYLTWLVPGMLSLILGESLSNVVRGSPARLSAGSYLVNEATSWAYSSIEEKSSFASTVFYPISWAPRCMWFACTVVTPAQLPPEDRMSIPIPPALLFAQPVSKPACLLHVQKSI